jgi:hypothetical protein
MTLPTFVIIGAGKSGTTSLYQWLRQHPDVYMPSTLKETFFFDFDPDDPAHHGAPRSRFPVRTRAEYEALFDGAKGAIAVGEASPSYLDDPGAPARMLELIPDARLIASIRDPVSRVYSHAQMNVRLGLATDLPADVRRLASTDEQDYHAKFVRWFAHFPREQFHVIRYDDLAADPTGTTQRIFAFLGVDAGFTPDTGERFNPGGLPRSQLVQRLLELQALRRLRPLMPMAAFTVVNRLRRLNAKAAPPLPPDLRAELRDRYRADVIATERLLGLDLSDWLR